MHEVTYVRVLAEKSKCLHCKGTLVLLCKRFNQSKSPQFYICWTCRRIYEVGRGEVLVEKPNSTLPWR